MINQKPKNYRKFVPLSIGDSLKSINKKFLYKFGKLDFIIHAKWGEIVGSFFVNHSEPIKINSIFVSINEDGSNIYERYLHVNVTPAAAIEFQHFQDKIIEKINSYFGFKALKGIKIHQQFIKKENVTINNKNTNLLVQEEDKKRVSALTPKLSDKKLEESIVKLGLSITKDQK